MSNLYTRSTDGSDSDGGTTWALAKATITGVAAIDAAGDTLWFSQVHAESTAAALTINIAGTVTNMSRLLCGNDAAEPPTALATGASITTTSNNGITVNGSFYAYGIAWNIATGASAASMVMCGTASTSEVQHYDNCNFRIGTTANFSYIYAGINTDTLHNRVRWKDSTLKLAGASQGIIVAGCDFEWNGGSVESGSSTPTVGCFAIGGAQGNGRGGTCKITGVDFSNFSTSVKFFDGTSVGEATMRNCTLPASLAATGWLIGSGMTGLGFRASAYNCDSGGTTYRMYIEDYVGTIRDETSVVRTGGASDGTTQISWKIAGNTKCAYPAMRLVSPEIFRAYPGNSTEDAAFSAGASKTVSIEIVHDGATAAKNDEVIFEVWSQDVTGHSKSLLATSAKSDVLATGATNTSSSATWPNATGTGPNGSSTWNKQTLSVTVAPQLKGTLIGKLIVTKNFTIYGDPKLTVA